MPSGLRASVVALTVSAVTVAAATLLLPPRTNLGSYSFVCDSFVRRQPLDPIASAICQISGAYRLRATLAIAALLAVLCFIPMLLARSRLAASTPAHVAWAATVAVVAVVTITLLAAVGSRFDQVFLDL